MSAEMLKILGALAILVLALVGGFLPTLLRANARAGRWLALGNVFAGGIFLGAALLHLLPHAIEAFEHAQVHTEGGHNHETPWAIILAAAGFFLILFIEKVIPPRRDFDEARMVDEALGETHHHAHLEGATYPGVLLLALSVHAFFAGLALGATESGAAIMITLVAILAHKLMESFALGVTLVSSPYPRKVVNRLLLIFAAVTPVGVLLGAFILRSIEGESLEFVEATMNALAAGTFLYIATVDILAEGFAHAKDRWPKFGFVVLGFVLMALIKH